MNEIESPALSLSFIDSKLCYRSPVADPNSKGVVFGMTLDTSEKQLALLYLATVQGIAYGTRHIVEHCNAHGHKVSILHTLFCRHSLPWPHNYLVFAFDIRLTHCLLVEAFQRTHCSSKNMLISLVYSTNHTLCYHLFHNQNGISLDGEFGRLSDYSTTRKRVCSSRSSHSWSCCCQELS